MADYTVKYIIENLSNYNISKVTEKINGIKFPINEMDNVSLNKATEEKDCEIKIVILSIPNLRNRQIINSIFNSSYHTKQTTFKFLKSKKEYKSTIFIGLEDLFVFQDKKDRVKYFNLDGRCNFFDSSIWFKYVSLLPNFEEDFKESIKQIFSLREKNLYDTNITKEFFEFRLRLYKNSYLAPFKGAHATEVTPFKFHSETQMKQKADKLKTKFSSSGIKWRLLLVDDYASKELKIGTKEDGPIKKAIIEKVLEIDKNKTKEDKWIEIVPCKSVSKFIDFYKKKKFKNDKEKKEPGQIYDIILLDYLLYNKSYVDKIGGREYSTDILKWIKGDIKFVLGENDNGKKLKLLETKRENTNNGKENSNKEEIVTFRKDLQAPLGKFWFFPISVFTYAFMEDIRQMGYTYYNDDWVIARGADPVNTPELFRYSLFKLMEAQLDEVYKHSVKENKESDDKYNTDLLIGFLKKHFINSKNIQKTAKNEYTAFLELYSNHKTLEDDKIKGSLFAASVLEQQTLNSASLFEHFQHLIYMLAYEPAYEWSKMWDEFIILKQRVKESLLQSESDLEFLKGIEQYIIDLQKQVSEV